MIRESLSAGARHVTMELSSANGAQFEDRDTTNGSTNYLLPGAATPPHWVKLVRAGNLFTAYMSPDGIKWNLVTSITIAMNASTFVGLSVTAHNAALLNTSTFDNVSIIQNATNAAPTLATPAAAAPATVTGTTTILSVLGADDGGESNLTYTWSTLGTPPAPVSFSTNGVNSAKTTTATFTKAGVYTFQVTIIDQGGLSLTSSVQVTVTQTLTGIIVTPASAFVANSARQTFTAASSDQFGNAMTIQPAFTWSISAGGAGGSITTSGVYTAPVTGTGTDIITAAAGALSASATVNVTAVATAPGISIDAGGAAIGAFVSDTDFTGGSTFTVSNAIDTSGVTNPAPWPSTKPNALVKPSATPSLT